MNATTRDLGLAIRDAIDSCRVDLFVDTGRGDIETIDTAYVDGVDVSDANNPIIFLSTGQRFAVHIVSI